MKQTIAFNNGSNSWVSRYSYTSSCMGWIKDHMISSPIFTSSQEILWKHDQSATTNNSFYGCNPAASGVSFAFNANPSANKIYKAFSIETPSANDFSETTDGAAVGENDNFGVNTFIVNNQLDPGNTNKFVTVNRLRSKGGILYGGISGVTQAKSNTRILPVGIVSEIIPSDLFEENGLPPLPDPNYYFVRISGPSSQFSGGGSYLCKSSEAYSSALDLSVDATASKILYQFGGGYLVQGAGNLEEGEGAVIAHRGNGTGVGEDMARGQFADVAVSFQTNSDFEIHAFNVEFEPTTLDHNS